jgi:hypothetical protein
MSEIIFFPPHDKKWEEAWIDEQDGHLTFYVRANLPTYTHMYEALEVM